MLLYLEPEPREILILRQYSDPPRLKSLQRSFSHFHDTMHRHIDRIVLAPGCDDRLRTLGFAISEVQIEREVLDQKIIVMASLVYPPIPPFRQVFLCDQIRSPSMTYAVKNFIPLVSDADSSGAATRTSRSHSPPVTDSVPGRAYWACIQEIRDTLHLTSYARILASVDLITYDKTVSDVPPLSTDLRSILRIAVAQPVISSKDGLIPDIVLWP
ncbi:hypothetical protein BC628DRAFT_373972 [Trametes gibbosa]|nr:hypothetical protein BC628DRAFT_373972 [Trametes gibbosa]